MAPPATLVLRARTEPGRRLRQSTTAPPLLASRVPATIHSGTIFTGYPVVDDRVSRRPQRRHRARRRATSGNPSSKPVTTAMVASEIQVPIWSADDAKRSSTVCSPAGTATARSK